MSKYDRANAYRAEKEAKEVKERAIPREPTPAMCVAGFLVSEAEHDPAGVWRAMWDAAPNPLLRDAVIAYDAGLEIGADGHPIARRPNKPQGLA